MKKNILTLILLCGMVVCSTHVFATEEETGDMLDEPTMFTNEGMEPGLFTNSPDVGSDGLVPLSGAGQPAAQSAPTGSAPSLSLIGLSKWFMGLLGYAVQLILALSLISFLYGIFRLVFLDASNEAERNKARKFMLWGICALFVMVSVWGLVNILKSSVFGGGSLIIPQLK